MDSHVSFPAAILAGLISFLSPCVLPLVPPYLCFMAGTTLEGAVLEIDEPGGRVACRRCAAEFETDDVIALCPCGSADVDLLRGRELRIRSVEVAA